MTQWTEQYWIQAWLGLYTALLIVLHRGRLEKSETYVCTFSLRQTTISQCQRNNQFTSTPLPWDRSIRSSSTPLVLVLLHSSARMGVPVKTSKNTLKTKFANWPIRGRLSISNPSRTTSRELNELNMFVVICNLVTARISPSNFPVIIFDSS